MSCKYCDLKRRKDEDDDAEWIAGEEWESESGDGGYICPHGDGFRMLVYYDARCACTVVDNIKYCPFCGEELKAPKEPLIKDERTRRVIRAWAEVNSVEEVLYAERTDKSLFVLTDMGGDDTSIMFVGWIPTLKDGADYTIDELCGEEEE